MLEEKSKTTSQQKLHNGKMDLCYGGEMMKVDNRINDKFPYDKLYQIAIK